MNRSHKAFNLIECLAVFFILVVLIVILIPALQPTRGGHDTAHCRNRLQLIALALHYYHDQYGTFPPAYIADSSGRPMHSWRVLILPFLDQQQLYAEYRFDEPWNGPHNSTLELRIRDLFACSKELGQRKGQQETMTSYLAVVGPDTMWPDARVVRLRDVTDDQSKTILLVEVANSGINWMEPRDLDVSQMAFVVNHPSKRGISSVHKQGANVAMVNGNGRFLSDKLPASSVRALLTRNGGELIDEL